MQEREWAVWEIRRLRRDVGGLSRKKEAARIEGEMDHSQHEALNVQRLLRLAEVSTMVGLGHTSIYNYIADGKFPAPVRIGIRGVRWKLSDVLAWQAKRVSR